MTPPAAAATAASLEDTIPLIDLGPYLRCDGEGDRTAAAAGALTSALELYGAVLVRDPRVSASDSDAFVDLMERYFAQPRADKLADARPEYFHQVGATPDYTERPRDNTSIAKHLDAAHRPQSDPGGREKDAKWRFFWRVGPRPTNTRFPQLNAEQVIPRRFAECWSKIMDAWGSKLLNTSITVAELLAIGLELPKCTLTNLMTAGAHLLAPTGTDLALYGKDVGRTLAGYHYDISLLSLHGKARYPGLHIWTKDGRRMPVVMPRGTILVQSGIQIEHLTAGRIKRGMHEVVVSPETAAAIAAANATPSSCKWRVSSTFFAHVHSDRSLKPLIPNAGMENNYPDISAGQLVANELKELELAGGDD